MYRRFKGGMEKLVVIVLLLGLLIYVFPSKYTVLVVLFFIPDIYRYLYPRDITPKIQEDRIRKYKSNHIPKTDYRGMYLKNLVGVQDTYDLVGNKIEGIAPNTDLALANLKMLIDSEEGTLYDVLELAKIYHRGMYNLEPNYDEAERLYGLLLGEGSNSEILEESKLGLNDIARIRALEWLNLPLDHDPFAIRDVVSVQNVPEEDNFEDVLEILEMIGDGGKDDSQNTHDTTVVSTVRNSINNMINTTEITKTNEQVYREITDMLHSRYESYKGKDALKSLNRIKNSEIKLSASPINDNEAMVLVWNRICSNKFKEHRENLEEILLDQLASMQEYGQTICPMGRLARIVDTMNVIDTSVTIKPKYAIREEMMNKAATIRNRTKLEGEDLRKEIYVGLKVDYVDSGIMTEGQFEVEVGGWLDYI